MRSGELAGRPAQDYVTIDIWGFIGRIGRDRQFHGERDFALDKRAASDSALIALFGAEDGRGFRLRRRKQQRDDPICVAIDEICERLTRLRRLSDLIVGAVERHQQRRQVVMVQLDGVPNGGSGIILDAGSVVPDQLGFRGEIVQFLDHAIDVYVAAAGPQIAQAYVLEDGTGSSDLTDVEAE